MHGIFPHSILSKTWLQNRSIKQLVIASILLSMLILMCTVSATIVLLMIYLREDGNNKVRGPPKKPSLQETDINETDNDPEDTPAVNIIDRRNWDAKPAVDTLPLTPPVRIVVIVDTVGAPCNTLNDCAMLVRLLQDSHKEHDSLWDIRYNFLVGGDGNIYEGRGWWTVGSTVPNCNHNTIGIAFIGDFSHTGPTEKQAKAGRRFIAFGVKNGHISRNYMLVYASQLIDQEGIVNNSEMLEKDVKTWPHWANVDYRKNDFLRQKFCDSKAQ